MDGGSQTGSVEVSRLPALVGVSTFHLLHILVSFSSRGLYHLCLLDCITRARRLHTARRHISASARLHARKNLELWRKDVSAASQAI